MTASTPLATLVSFGSMAFTGASRPAGILSDTAPLRVAGTASRPRSNGSALLFPVTRQGYAAASLSTTTVTAVLSVVAADQSDPGVALQAVEDAVGGWWNAWTSDYLWHSTALASGQTGDLCLADVAGTTYVAPAELLAFESNPKGGEPGLQVLTLVFALLAPLQSGTPAPAGAPTGTTHLPSLRLVSFGPLVFTGAGAPASTQNDSGPLQMKATAARPRHAVCSSLYGVSSLGLSPGPLTRVELSCVLYACATPDLAPAAAYQATEDAWGVWDTAWRGSNTARGFAASGQIGRLVVTDSHGAQWQAEAELTDLAAPPELGSVAVLTIPLTFRLLSLFTAVPTVPTTARYGTAIYGTSRYG